LGRGDVEIEGQVARGWEDECPYLAHAGIEPMGFFLSCYFKNRKDAAWWFGT